MNDNRQITPVIPAEAGIQYFWVPASAGTTLPTLISLP
jgi:hypothetical protein